MADYDSTDCPKCRGPLSSFDRYCPYCRARVPRHAYLDSPGWTVVAIVLGGLFSVMLVDPSLLQRCLSTVGQFVHP
jgi:hypothetical protein